VPRKFLILHWPQICQGSGVGSIPIGRSIQSSTYKLEKFFGRDVVARRFRLAPNFERRLL
jgi:hypothetical protein